MSQIQLDARAASSTGLEPRSAAALAYLAGPFSGIIILLAERTNRFVRFLRQFQRYRYPRRYFSDKRR